MVSNSQGENATENCGGNLQNWLQNSITSFSAIGIRYLSNDRGVDVLKRVEAAISAGALFTDKIIPQVYSCMISPGGPNRGSSAGKIVSGKKKQPKAPKFGVSVNGAMVKVVREFGPRERIPKRLQAKMVIVVQGRYRCFCRDTLRCPVQSSHWRFSFGELVIRKGPTNDFLFR